MIIYSSKFLLSYWFLLILSLIELTLFFDQCSSIEEILRIKRNRSKGGDTTIATMVKYECGGYG
jgi:hypothetical protein